VAASGRSRQLVFSATLYTARKQSASWLLIPAVAILLVASCLIVVASVFGGVGNAGTMSSGPPSTVANQLIPADMLALYQSDIVKQQCPTLSWTIVAAIIHVESDDNRNPGTSSAGAMGASQFLPTTWDNQGTLVVNVGTSFGKIPDGQGYGVDGDGDGVADIMNPLDSVPATARMLCANGGSDPSTLPQAIYAYNHAWWYVYGGTDDNGNAFEGVLPLAAKLASSVVTAPVSSPQLAIAIQAALTQIGKPYVWGGESETNGFDCSGLMQWAFAKAGILLPRTSAAQYTVGTHVTRDQLQVGDLVFWANNTSDPSTIHHVALYLGNGQIVAAPHRGTVVQVEAIYWNGFIGGTRLTPQDTP
jgi:cell wall-associated NlpC family hydrolase